MKLKPYLKDTTCPTSLKMSFNCSSVKIKKPVKPRDESGKKKMAAYQWCCRGCYQLRAVHENKHIHQ